MGEILSAYLTPHPPIIVPEVGRGEERKIKRTSDAMNIVAKEISEQKPDTIIVMSPHGYVFRDAVSVDLQPVLKGDLGQFMASSISMSYENNLDLAKMIINNTKKRGIPIAEIDDKMIGRYGLIKKLDHGTIVPLYFVTKQYKEFNLVHMSYGFLPFEQLYEFGVAIQQSIEEYDGKVVFIASGDLSHKLTKNSPNGYTPNGEVFDRQFLKYLGEMDVIDVIGMDKGLIEDAAECGYRSVCVLLGVLDGYDIKAEVLSHEGPFGVGYGVASFIPGAKKRNKLLDKLYRIKKEKINKIRREEDPYVKLARESLEYYVKYRKTMDIPDGLPSEMLNEKAGVFVSLHKDGELRGCIGTIIPQRENIAQEIIMNAISAGFEDNRFYEVQEDELGDIVYSVDVLTTPEKIHSKAELDPKKYGVIVRSGYRSGLLLPDLDGVNSVEEQVSIALRKAGIRPTEDYSLERFQVVRHK